MILDPSQDDIGPLSGVLKDFMLSGTLNILSTADYIITIMLLNTYLLQGGNVSLGGAVSYVNMFTNIVTFALTMGYNFTMMNFSGQCSGKQEYRKINLYYRQVAFFSNLNFLIFGIGGWFLLPYGQRALSMDEETIGYTSQLLLVCLPAIFIRTNEDNLKYLLRGQGIIKQVGMGINVAVVLFLVYSYVIMVTLDMGIYGYGLCLFIYEVTSCSVSIYCFFRIMNAKCREMTLPFTKNIFFTFKSSLKITVPLLVTWVSGELLIILLTMLHSDA